MYRLIGRVQIAYLGLFVLVCAGVFAYESMFIWPMQSCESNGGWWSAKYRECATPIPVWRITGRRPGQPRAAAPLAGAITPTPTSSATASSKKL